MASKAIYCVVAAGGIAAACGAAWWFQQPAAGSSLPTAAGVEKVALDPLATKADTGKLLSVEAANVERRTLSDDTQAVGSLRSRRGVMLRPEVSGRITQLNFTDGQRVRKGETLVQFDDQLPLAQLQQSRAELSIALANQKRNQELVAENFISQRSLDESAANLQVAQAKLALAQATANRLKILAPFDGIAGIRQVNVGDYLKDGADIVNVEDIDAIFVDFRLPERFQRKLLRGQKALLDIDALPGRQYLAQIQAIDPLVDVNGRSVGVRGCLDNRFLQLRPGMFARVNVVFDVREDALVVPEEAIVSQGARQFVVKLLDDPAATDKTPPGQAAARLTKRVEVRLGLRGTGQVEIVQGLHAGDTVITAGQQRVQKDGTRVVVMPADVASAVQGTGTVRKSVAIARADAGPQAGANPCGVLPAPVRGISPGGTGFSPQPASPAAHNAA